MTFCWRITIFWLVAPTAPSFASGIASMRPIQMRRVSWKKRSILRKKYCTHEAKKTIGRGGLQEMLISFQSSGVMLTFSPTLIGHFINKAGREIKAFLIGITMKKPRPVLFYLFFKFRASDRKSCRFLIT